MITIMRLPAELSAPPTPPAAPAIGLPDPAAKTGGVKKLSFGKIATKKEDTKTAYPVFPDPNGTAAALAATIIRQVQEFDALEGSLKTNKEELKFMVAPEYFRVNHGKHDAPSSVSVKSTEGEVLVTFQNRYKTIPDESPVVTFLGDRTGEFFRQAFELKISGDKLPAASARTFLMPSPNCSPGSTVPTPWKSKPASNPPRIFTPPVICCSLRNRISNSIRSAPSSPWSRPRAASNLHSQCLCPLPCPAPRTDQNPNPRWPLKNPLGKCRAMRGGSF